ncbi:hypothetical protein HDEF_1169 [Candidatus Hamiltonella defensa 5AT (Acyrthosiphon pisum)]|uniref:Uncharacterized protein n=1 Tax=Hamiltonella defensa subsp. Acyrthosiphon pisum (strain 5AT) TaxID=572265 RepID=C4K5I8_HAMD5|nr:hypothetical protein HDEF_1169 [Candidatus Hamiltonella defensa 5AT (Acyrthosiphon pisum)]
MLIEAVYYSSGHIILGDYRYKKLTGIGSCFFKVDG